MLFTSIFYTTSIYWIWFHSISNAAFINSLYYYIIILSIYNYIFLKFIYLIKFVLENEIKQKWKQKVKVNSIPHISFYLWVIVSFKTNLNCLTI